MAIIYKIFREDEYASFVSEGETAGAAVDLADGYIHLSARDQVEETAAKHFAGETELKLLGLDSNALGDALKWEKSRGGALFPHLYRPLKEQDVVFCHDLPVRDGRHCFEGLPA